MRALAPRVGAALPELTVIRQLKPGEGFDAQAALAAKQANAAAIVTGSLAAPKLTGTAERIAAWQGPVSMLAAQALGRAPQDLSRGQRWPRWPPTPRSSAMARC